jgi:hypothetical protein
VEGRVLLCGGLLVLLLVGGERHLPVLVLGRLPVLVGGWLLLSLQKRAGIGLLHVAAATTTTTVAALLLLLPLLPQLVLLMAVVLRLLVGG